MDIPRGHAMLPLNEADFLDFIFNYFKAEYYPIRSFFSTATAEPRQQHRWISMGHELSPLTFRPANAQAQKDLESLDFFVRQKNLDAGFVRGIVIRFAKYEVHERLEKKLYESCRLDLMVRKALKEKHLIDALWPSPAPRNIAQDLLQQGVKVRSWYGDMFNKYFRHLHSVDDFSLRPEVDARIKSSGTLMLVPFVDHLVFGAVDPIMPIIAKGAGYANAKAWKTKSREGGGSFGEPDRFEIRFDAPADLEDTHTRSVVRQCQCLKCGSKRDVTVVISVDPSPGPVAQTSRSTRRPSNPSISARRQNSKAAQKYSPGYAMPGDEQAPSAPPTAQPPRRETAETAASQPVQQKQCSKCTFLNHAELTSCEMCGTPLSNTDLVSKPPSPVLASSQPVSPSATRPKPQTRPQKTKSTHSHSASLPPPVVSEEVTEVKKEGDPTRPGMLNRHSISSTLFSIFPFNQQQQTEHHAKLPATQESTSSTDKTTARPKSKDGKRATSKEADSVHEGETSAKASSHTTSAPPNLIDGESSHHTEWEQEGQRKQEEEEKPSTPPLTQPHQLNILPMTPPPSSSTRPLPRDMPANLMDDFVPVSPSYPREEEEEDAGWGEMSREEARKGDDEEDEDDEEEGWEQRRGLVDLDAVAREEMGVWGDKEDD